MKRGSKVSKVSKWYKDPTKAEKLAEYAGYVAWYTKLAKQWENVNPIEHARCLRIAERALEDLGRIEAGAM